MAALSAACGSACFVAVGAYVVFTTNPAPRPTSVPAPMLLSGYRFPAATPPSLVGAQPAAPSPFAPQSDSAFAIPAVTSGASVTAGPGGASGAVPSLNPPQVIADSNKPPARPESKRELRVVGNKTAALTPPDAGVRPEPPPRPVVEIKKNSLVPELRTALPTTRSRGVLTAAEIARIRHSLRLTPDQEQAWPRVEAALAEMGRQQIALLHQGQEPRISQSEWPPGRLYSVAGPLLQVLRPDQKETVRRLCRSLGFEAIASMI